MISLSALPTNVADNQQAYVVFSDGNDFKLLKWLKPGFRHCCILLRSDNNDNGPKEWTIIDPLSHRLMVQQVRETKGMPGLPDMLRGKGMTLVSVQCSPAPRKLAPMLPISCVEVVKRVIGLHSWRIITPYQLYRYLLKQAIIGADMPFIKAQHAGA